MSAFRAKATNLLGALQSTVGTAIEMLTTVKVGKSKGANLLHIECLACQSKASQPVTSSGSSGVAVCSVLEFVRKARAVEARDCSSQIGNAAARSAIWPGRQTAPSESQTASVSAAFRKHGVQVFC